jgi:predicted outer membrane repeat protein
MKTRSLKSSRHSSLKTALLLAAAALASPQTALAATINNQEALTPEQLAEAGWDGALRNLVFLGTVPEALSAASISAILSFPADCAFTATPGTAEQALLLDLNYAGAFVLGDGVSVNITGNNDSAVTLSAGAAFYVGSAGTTAGSLFIADNTAATGAAIKTIAPLSGVGALLLLTNATLASNAASGSGGAVFADRANLLTFSATTFRGNTAVADGGAVHADGGTLIFNNTSVFENNTATGSGGAINAVNAAALTLANTTFSANTAALGGAIRLTGAGTTATVTSTAFTANTAQTSGGALALTAGAKLVLNPGATFTANTATTSFGGALYFDAATLESPATAAPRFDANTAALSGGAIHAANGTTLTLADPVFTNNTAGGAGGAIYLSSSTARLTVSAGLTSTFSGNTAGATATPNSIHLESGNSGTATLEITTTATGLLDLLDPLSGSAGNAANPGAITIRKNGAGTMNLAGQNIFSAANADSSTLFSVAQGKLHLYRAADPAAPTHATPTLAAGIDLDTTGEFSLAPGATLSIGGGNTIHAGRINLASGATLAFDLAATTGSPLLTLTGGEKISLPTGDEEPPKPFVFAATTVALTNFSTLADGTHVLVDASTINITDRTFNTPDTLILDGNQAAGIRTADGAGHSLTLNADRTAKQLTLTVATTTAAGTAELLWTGNTSGTWKHAAPDDNWNGLTADGLLAVTFRDGDTVVFGDDSATTALTLPGPDPVRPATLVINGNTTAHTLTGTSATTTGIAATGALELNGPAGLTLRDTTATFDGGVALNNGILTLDNANLHATAGSSFIVYGGLTLGTATTNANLHADTIEIYGYLSGNGRINANLALKPGAVLSPGPAEGTIGTLELNGNFTNEGTLLIEVLNGGTHDILRNTSTNTVAIGGTILFSVDRDWFIAGNKIIPAFLETTTGAGAIRLAPNVNLAFTDDNMRGEIINEYTGEIRLTRFYALPGARNGLAAFVSELDTLAWFEDNPYAAVLLYDTTGNSLRDPRLIAAASPIGYAAIPNLLTRAASDATAALRDHLASRRTAASTDTGADFYFLGAGNILTNGHAAADPAFNANSGAVIAGVDAPLGTLFNGTLLAGANVAGHFGQAQFHDNAGKLDQSQYRATAYATASPTKHLTLDASVSGGISRFESKRHLRGQPGTYLDGTVLENTGTTEALDIGASLYAATAVNFLDNTLAIEPYAGFEYLYISADSLTEKGNYDAALRVNSIEQDSYQIKAGANLVWKTTLGGVPARLLFNAAYGRELGDTDVALRARLANATGARKVDVPTAYTTADTFQTGPTVEISSGKSALTAGYRYETDFNNRTSHHIHAEFRVKF